MTTTANVGVGSTPLLVFDAWEHACYLQYRNVRPDYVARLWSLANWADVDRRFRTARAGSAAPPSAGGADGNLGSRYAIIRYHLGGGRD